MTVQLAVAVAAFLIGFNKAGVAGTIGPFVTVWLVLTMPADQAVALLLPLLIVGDWFTLAAHWKQWDAKIYRTLLVGALMGIVAGSLVVSSVSAALLRRLIALAMLGFVMHHLRGRLIQAPRARTGRYALVAGAGSGLLSTLAHLGGPPVYVYLTSTALAPRAFVATSAVLFATVNLLKVPAYWFAGLFDVDLILRTLWTWAAIPVGVVVGRMVVGRINPERFEWVTIALLGAGAVVLLVL